MQRRQFLAAAGAATLAPAITPARADAPRLPVKMRVGCQRQPTSPEMLRFFKRHGVDSIVGYPEFPKERGYWDADDLGRLKDLASKHGVTVEMVAFPFLHSSHVDRTERAGIVLGKDPDRQRDIEHLQKMIAACAKTGIKGA